MRIEEIMNPRVSSIEQDRPVVEALRLRGEKEARMIAVTRSGKCVGVISLRAIEKELLPIFRRGVDSELLAAFSNRKVSELMDREAPLLNVDTEIVVAIDYFLRSELDALPVIDAASKSVCGAVSAREILQAARTLFDD